MTFEWRHKVGSMDWTIEIFKGTKEFPKEFPKYEEVQGIPRDEGAIRLLIWIIESNVWADGSPGRQALERAAQYLIRGTLVSPGTITWEISLRFDCLDPL